VVEPDDLTGINPEYRFIDSRHDNSPKSFGVSGRWAVLAKNVAMD